MDKSLHCPIEPFVEVRFADELDSAHIEREVASFARASAFKTSDASDVLLPVSVEGQPVEDLLREAIQALLVYGRAVDKAMQSLEPDRWRFLEAAYALWRETIDRPNIVEMLTSEFRVRVTRHRRGPFSTVLKILHAAAGIGADSIQFASYHCKLLERCHEHFCRQAGLEPDPNASPAVAAGAVMALLTEAGSVKAAVKNLTPKEDEAVRQSRIEAERARIGQWLQTGLPLKIEIEKEDRFTPDIMAYVAVIVVDDSGALLLKLVEEAHHTTLLRYTKIWEMDQND